jgi:hypothetical protein
MPLTDSEKEALEARIKAAMKSAQERVVGAWPALEDETVKDLLKRIRGLLLRASNVGLLKTGTDEIFRWVRSNDKPEADEEILGGVKTSRDPAHAHIIRDDDAWIHFKIRVRQENRKTLMLIGYDFEIVFPEGRKPPWLRVDLNPPNHPNADREIRSHLHPGNDDLQWPAPVMTPLETLAFMLGPALRPRDADNPRA